ncbi:MAG: response regulator [Bdellovibrionales bacterium]|nr:response regulator [Bdellovibrionales bacterium]
MKVLVIDDEALVRKALARVAKMKGHEVFEAEDGIEGHRLWIENCPDLVFVDVLMPRMNGPQLLQEMGSEHRAKVVLISAYSGDYNLETAKSIGADMFVPKPFTDIFLVFDTAEGLCRLA